MPGRGLCGHYTHAVMRGLDVQPEDMVNTCSETWLTGSGAVKSIAAIWMAPKKIP